MLGKHQERSPVEYKPLKGLCVHEGEIGGFSGASVAGGWEHRTCGLGPRLRSSEEQEVEKFLSSPNFSVRRAELPLKGERGLPGKGSRVG